jgi:1-aminocyclopropane-1-carboxylate deaminase
MFFTEKLRPRVDSLQFSLLQNKNIKADVLRLDLIDPLVSGNKWFKLNEYIADAHLKNKSTVVTFGGAFSNHILATASYCHKAGLKSVAVIRGEEHKPLSSTLQTASLLGMDLFFVTREEYRKKQIPKIVFEKHPDHYLVNEGGYGMLGKKGAQAILDLPNSDKYTHIISAVGTGTTLAGLIEASNGNQEVIGISSLKNNRELENAIRQLLPTTKKNSFKLLHDFHFGGYAKYDEQLIEFMNDWFALTNIPTDFVYTAKAFYAFNEMVKKNAFPPESEILLVHTGGLQGNNSLKKGTLIF